MKRVKKTRGGIVYLRSERRRFRAGDTAEVSADKAAYLSEERGDFTIVDDVTTDVPDPGEFTLDELEEELAGVDTVDTLDAIESAERDGKGRDGAFERIDARRTDLTEEE